MKRICLYCQADFDSKRLSKKYCSDNCKQLAYFKRHRLQISTSKSDASKEDDKLISPENEISDLMDEIALKVVKLINLRHHKAEASMAKERCNPITFGIQKFNTERREQ